MLIFERLARVERVVEIALLLQAFGLCLRREEGEARGMPADVGQALRADRQRIAAGIHDQIVGEYVLHQLERFVEEKLLLQSSVLPLDGPIAACEDVDVLADVADLKQTGLDAVVEVRGEIGDLVREVDDLRLQRRALV